MTETLKSLIALAETDIKLALVLSEEQKIDEKLKLLMDQVEIAKLALQNSDKVLGEKKTKLLGEEQFFEGERTKLSEKRKQVSQNFQKSTKQDSAEREIDYAMRQLAAREKGLGRYKEDVSVADLAQKNTAEVLKKTAALLDEYNSDIQDIRASVAERKANLIAGRDEYLKMLPATIVPHYERSRSRWPMSPIAPLDMKGNCSACSMKVGPQIVVQVSRGELGIRCPGCTRIMYPDTQSAEKTA